MPVDGILRLLIATALIGGTATVATAQEPDPHTREEVIAQEQAEKAQALRPYVPGRSEELLNKAEVLLADGLPWYPYFENAYAGGGFTVGVGHAIHVSPYNTLNVRGSYTLAGYKRVEAELTAPRLFNRRGALSVLGGWREATQVGFYGLGTNTSKGDRTNYDFQQPYGSATLTLWPTRRLLLLRGGMELSQWSQRPGEGRFPSVETVFSPDTLPGLGTRTTYVHSQGTVGYDWRTSPGYSRRGGFYGVTLHDYADRNQQFGFRQVDYEAIQHRRSARAVSYGESDDDHRGAARVAGRPRQHGDGGHRGRERRTPGVAAADSYLFPAKERRLDARGSRAAAREPANCRPFVESVAAGAKRGRQRQPKELALVS